jgi:hypothetical protein
MREAREKGGRKYNASLTRAASGTGMCPPPQAVSAEEKVAPFSDLR